METLGSRDTVDLCAFAEKIGCLVEENVVDLELRKWMMPAFSTTTKHDIDHPGATDTVDFWNRIFNQRSCGSGPVDYSGWITAFCFWDAKGMRLNKPAPQEAPSDGIGVVGEHLYIDGVAYGSVKHTK